MVAIPLFLMVTLSLLVFVPLDLCVTSFSKIPSGTGTQTSDRKWEGRREGGREGGKKEGRVGGVTGIRTSV